MKTTITTETVLDYCAGSLWFDPNGGELFVMSLDEKLWVAVSLRDGSFWEEPTDDAKEAVTDLEYFTGTAEVSN